MRQRSISPDFLQVSMAVDGDVRARIREQFSKYDGTHEAGLILAFGGAATEGQGVQLAAQVGQMLKEELPFVFGEATLRPMFYKTGGSARFVEFEVYFYTTQ